MEREEGKEWGDGVGVWGGVWQVLRVMCMRVYMCVCVCVCVCVGQEAWRDVYAGCALVDA